MRSLFSILKKGARHSKMYGRPRRPKKTVNDLKDQFEVLLDADVNLSEMADNDKINDHVGYSSSTLYNEVAVEQVFKASNDRFKKISSQEFQNLMMAYSQITRERRKRWSEATNARKWYKASLEQTKPEKPPVDDELVYYGTYKTKLEYEKDPLIINSEYKRNNRFLFTTNSQESNELYEQLRKETEELENKLEEFSQLLRSSYGHLNNNLQMRMGDEDPTVEMTFEEQYKLRNERMFKEFERQMELESEITHTTLKKELEMAKDKEAKEPHVLYKKLNRKFKKSFTEDFFREPVAACVEVLEYVAAWIAEQLSLPPPEPVNHDLVIYKRVDTNNYSYFTSAIHNKKVQYLTSWDMALNKSKQRDDKVQD